ncbi:MAG: chorismate-binding protein [Bacteroidota bacterium]|nr:chorismate-binding protein [Bacteroidota bacterium]
MTNTTLTDIHAVCIKKNIPFASWRTPNEKNCKTIIANKAQKLKSPDFTSLKGFVASPFNFFTKKNLWLLSPDYFFENNNFDMSSLFGFPDADSNPDKEIYYSSFDDYKKQFTHFKKLFANNTLQKGVLSRIIKTETTHRGNAEQLFKKLTESYPDAMVYIINIPGEGLWIGATPEPFIKTNNERYQTSSVAATQPFTGKSIKWSEKEIEEQQIVTDYITGVLKKTGITDFTKQRPKTYRAGNVSHLKTDFTISKEIIKPHLNNFLHNLHPTPAVCGIPKQDAYNEILRTEHHNREFYTGFLGSVGMEEDLQLFVNLRCMQIFEKHSAVYVGGGLTSGSVLESEWRETEYKSASLLRIAETTHTKTFNTHDNDYNGDFHPTNKN